MSDAVTVHHCDHCSTRTTRVYHEEGKHTRSPPVMFIQNGTEFNWPDPISPVKAASWSKNCELVEMLQKYTAEEVAEALKEAYSFPRLATIRAKITR